MRTATVPLHDGETESSGAGETAAVRTMTRLEFSSRDTVCVIYFRGLRNSIRSRIRAPRTARYEIQGHNAGHGTCCGCSERKGLMLLRKLKLLCCNSRPRGNKCPPLGRVIPQENEMRPLGNLDRIRQRLQSSSSSRDRATHSKDDRHVLITVSFFPPFHQC